jgi:hypothetical protein
MTDHGPGECDEPMWTIVAPARLHDTGMRSDFDRLIECCARSPVQPNLNLIQLTSV